VSSGSASHSNSNFLLAIRLIEQRVLCLNKILCPAASLICCNCSIVSSGIQFIKSINSKIGRYCIAIQVFNHLLSENYTQIAQGENYRLSFGYELYAGQVLDEQDSKVTVAVNRRRNKMAILFIIIKSIEFQSQYETYVNKFQSIKLFCNSAISSAVAAASSPLFPCIPPERAWACSRLLVVSTPNITGLLYFILT